MIPSGARPAWGHLKTGLRTIEVRRAGIEHLQEQVPGQTWRLWVHGRGRSAADQYV